MAVIGRWRKDDTRRGILFPLDLGADPITGDAREVGDDDTVTMVMRCRTSASPTALVRTITTLNDGPYTFTVDGQEVDFAQAHWWKPEDGDFTEGGVYDLVFQLTDVDGDVETIPANAVDDYQFEIDLIPGDTGYEAGV